MSDIEDVDSLLRRNESWAKLMAWGFFIIFLAGSVAVPAIFIIGFHIIYVWVGLFLIFSGVIGFMEFKDAKYKFKFWIEINKFNGPRLKSAHVVLSGATLCAFLLLLIYQQMIFLFTTLSFLLFFPLMYFLSRYRLKTDKGKSFKQFHARVDDAEKAVDSALRSLKVTHQRTDEDQIWILKMPTFEIEEYGITIQVYRYGRSNATVTIQSSNPLAPPKIQEIERGIDSALETSIRN